MHVSTDPVVPKLLEGTVLFLVVSVLLSRTPTVEQSGVADCGSP